MSRVRRKQQTKRDYMENLVRLLILFITIFSMSYGVISNHLYSKLREDIRENDNIPYYVKDELLR
jgi:hypothetical protein